MSKSLLLLISFLCPLIAAGQNVPAGAPPSTFTLIGTVRTPEGVSAGGVRMTVIDENYQMVKSSFVDGAGRFRVGGLVMGKYTVNIETTGTPYEEQTQQIDLQSLRRMGGDETMTLEFKLRYKKGSEAAGKGTVFAQDVPKAARTEFERGLGQLRGNKSEAAIAAFKKAIELFPDYFEALELLGVEYTKGGQYESAVEALTHALRINSRAPKSIYAIGVAQLNLHHLPEAIEWLGKVTQLDSNNPNAQMMLGLAYGNGGALDKAEAAFKKALQLGGAAAAEAHFYLAGLYNKQNKYHEARQELEQFLKEAKNVKEPAQIKAMIEKLKEKERIKPGEAQVASAAPTPSQAVPALNNQDQAAPDTRTQTPNQAADTTESAATEKSPKTEGSLATSPESEAFLHDPVQPLPPDAAEMLQQSQATGGAMHKQLLDYTYLLKKTRRVLDERGSSMNAEEQIFEAYPIHGEHVLIRLSTNGKPSATLADDRKRAVKQLEEAERQRNQPAAKNEGDKPGDLPEYVTAGVTGVYGRKTGYVSINVSAFLRACEFFAPRVERIADREMLVLNFRRRAGLNLPPNQSYISKLVGTIWVDQADKVITRLEAWPAAQAAFGLLQSTAPRDDAALIYQQQRLANGLWFPTVIRMNAGGRTDLFDGLNWDVVFEFSNYQHFDSSASNVIINSPNKNP